MKKILGIVVLGLLWCNVNNVSFADIKKPKTIHQRQNIIYLTVLKYLRLISINNNFIDFIL